MAARRSFSARWNDAVVDRLALRSEAVGTTKSRLAERYVEEGLRADEHPGIVFRGGPAGRRAAVAGGPDVWEVVAVLKEADEEAEPIAWGAESLNLSEVKVRAALRYYSQYSEEIDERLRRNVEEADAAEAAWRREQTALT